MLGTHRVALPGHAAGVEDPLEVLLAGGGAALVVHGIAVDAGEVLVVREELGRVLDLVERFRRLPSSLVEQVLPVEQHLVVDRDRQAVARALRGGLAGAGRRVVVPGDQLGIFLGDAVVDLVDAARLDELADPDAVDQHHVAAGVALGAAEQLLLVERVVAVGVHVDLGTGERGEAVLRGLDGVDIGVALADDVQRDVGIAAELALEVDVLGPRRRGGEQAQRGDRRQHPVSHGRSSRPASSLGSSGAGEPRPPLGVAVSRARPRPRPAVAAGAARRAGGRPEGRCAGPSRGPRTGTGP